MLNVVTYSQANSLFGTIQHVARRK